MEDFKFENIEPNLQLIEALEDNRRQLFEHLLRLHTLPREFFSGGEGESNADYARGSKTTK